MINSPSKYVEREHHSHKAEAYLAEFVYGGIDGSVTTFAVVAGAAGAHLDSSVVIILGFANLIADGFSMSVGSYLSAKSKQQQYTKYRQQEYWEIKHLRESEVEEIREIFRKKGFEGELLEQVVAKITEDEERWVDVMMKDELGIARENKPSWKIALITFLSFITIGLIPLTVYLLDYFKPLHISLFTTASIATSLAFIVIGIIKARITLTPVWKALSETLLLGAVAASMAYYAGHLLELLLR